MTSKDTRLEKLRKLFSFKGLAGSFKHREDFVLSSELEKELSSDAPISSRMRIIKDLTENVTCYSTDDKGVAKLWVLLKDLFQPTVPKEHRHVTFQFFCALIQDKHNQLGIMRSKFFDFIKNHSISEDIAPRLELFQKLTYNGRYFNYFEEEAGTFLLEWMPSVLKAGLALNFLGTLVNVFKYNTSYIDEPIVAGLVLLVCQECCTSTSEGVVNACLEVLSTAVCYPSLPPECLAPFIATLCRTVNFEVYCSRCWKIMKNLLGTHLGYRSLHIMCQLLKEEASLADPGLLRGAVFYTNMALWGGPNRVSALRSTPAAVLPSFRAALQCNHPLVMYEIVLSLQRLIQSHGEELLYPAWADVLDMLITIATYLDGGGVGSGNACLREVSIQLHTTIGAVEQRLESGDFDGPTDAVHDLIMYCSAHRPEASVLRWLSHLGNDEEVRSGRLNDVGKLFEKFYRNDPRPAIRIKALSLLTSVIKHNSLAYEDKVIPLVKTHLANAAKEPELAVRTAVAQLLTELVAHCHPQHLPELLDILEEMLNHATEGKEVVDSEEAGLDMKMAANGLIQVLERFLYTPETLVVIRAYSIICRHLALHYSATVYLASVTSIRYMMLEWLLALRADVQGRVGLEGDIRRHSNFLTASAAPQMPITSSSPSSVSPNPSTTISVLPISPAVNAIAAAILHELDWNILLLILQELPNVLKNKALLVSKHGSEVHQLAKVLCAMVTDNSVCSPERLKNTPPIFNRSELQNFVFPVLASLVSYHAYLEPTLQQKIVKCLERGLASKSAASQCVLALTTCTLEMRDTMVKLLPEVLLNLSKLTDTIVIAIHILEFLSTLTQLPSVFANFVGDQYMAVFAILLPYTNPLRYTHYTVSLAHHVIAAWFLKCRVPFRRDFVRFIIDYLKTIIHPVRVDEGQPLVNEDSSNRKRSSSLTEQGSSSRRRERAPRIDLKPASHDENSPLHAFHSDLTETCIDLMSMYSFSNVSSLPKRLSSAEKILNEGQSMSWLVGNKIVTVTTSGCTLKPLRHGLCDRCYHSCRIHHEFNNSYEFPGFPNADPGAEKKSHAKGPVPQANADDDSAEHPDPSKVELSKNGGEKKERTICSCWCQGWAEILIRRPTGVVSWMMRVQNGCAGDLPDGDVSSIFLPPPNNPYVEKIDLSKSERVCSEPVSIPVSPVKRSNTYSDYDDIEFEVNGRSRNPVRRSNSSPEMSASWKSPLADDSANSSTSPAATTSDPKKKVTYSKDHRLNCEAIPEELGTTPPTCEALMLAPMDAKPPAAPREVPTRGHRDRGHTISVMSPVRKPGQAAPRPRHRSGANPASIFLQLYHSTHFGSTLERPILLPPTEQKSLSILDLILPFEVHKISVLYVGPGQTNSETDILKNQFGSIRYAQFLQRLGTLIDLTETDKTSVYLGGLQTDGNDGKFTYIWHDDVMQVVFHVATLMPNLASEPHATNKKAHIGNNHVHIVYNDSGEDYNLQTLKAQFNSAVVVIEPLDLGSNLLSVKAREELVQHICLSEYKIVSDQSVAILARQLAIHANLAARITSRKNMQANKIELYASNWLERLRWIKRLQTRLVPESRHRRRNIPDDFTTYTIYDSDKSSNV